MSIKLYLITNQQDGDFIQHLNAKQ